MKSTIFTTRNLARETRVFNPPELQKSCNAIVQIPTGRAAWKEKKQDVVGFRAAPGGPVIYVPEEWEEQLCSIPPESQVLLAAICAIFKEQVKNDFMTVIYHRDHMGCAHGIVKTSIRELVRRVGMSDFYKNRRKIADTLIVMQHIHVCDLLIDRKKEESSTKKKKEEKSRDNKINLGRLLTWVNFTWQNKESQEEKLNKRVEITINPNLTEFIISGTYGFTVEIPVNILKTLHEPRRSGRLKYSIPLLFFLQAANPGNGKFKISLKNAVERACIPTMNKKRKKRPAEIKFLMDNIFGDLSDAEILSFERSNHNIYEIYFCEVKTG
ncbi:MAG: hypothetical protein K9L17_08420 [Clostridiales bacterium]|nr:hypothetical protein [Clostridiales bacterium]MCF8022700.1 hypothetical protein [Clostridiales bacterium]